MALSFLARVVLKLDKDYVSKNILPSLEYIVNRDKTPVVTTAVLDLYKIIADKCTSTAMISRDILPSLVPLTSDKAFNAKQFEQTTRLTAYLLNKVVEFRCQQYGIPKISLSDVSSFEEPPPDTAGSRGFSNAAASTRSEKGFPHVTGSEFGPGIPSYTANSQPQYRQHDIQALAVADIWQDDYTSPSPTLPQAQDIGASDAIGRSMHTPTGLKDFGFNGHSLSQSISSLPMSLPSHPLQPAPGYASNVLKPQSFPMYAYPPSSSSTPVDPFDFSNVDVRSSQGMHRLGSDSAKCYPEPSNAEKEDPFAFLNS